LAAQQSPSGQHDPSGQQAALAFTAAATASQHGPPGQQIPSGQQDSPAAMQQSPSGQHGPSGQQAAVACPASAGVAGVVNAPLQAAPVSRTTAATAAAENNFVRMVSFSLSGIRLAL
jgi:hypothetical protein